MPRQITPDEARALLAYYNRMRLPYKNIVITFGDKWFDVSDLKNGSELRDFAESIMGEPVNEDNTIYLDSRKTKL